MNNIIKPVLWCKYCKRWLGVPFDFEIQHLKQIREYRQEAQTSSKGSTSSSGPSKTTSAKGTFLSCSK